MAFVGPHYAFAQEQDPGVLSDVGSYNADARSARITNLKTQYKINLSEKEKALVSSRCEGAQSELRKISARLITTKKDREAVYSNTVITLIRLKTLLETKQIDTSNIDLLIVSYQQKKATFDVAVLAYELSLEDVTSIDCVKSPEDFRAGLEGVRGARKPIVDASAQIQDITRSNLKTTFDTIRIKLQTVEG